MACIWSFEENTISETAHKASVPEDHKPKWESADRRAFVVREIRDSLLSDIVNACRNELCNMNNPFHPVSGKTIEYRPIRITEAVLNTVGLGSIFTESINVVLYGKVGKSIVIWLTRNFPVFDFFGCKKQHDDWTRDEIYIPEEMLKDSVIRDGIIRNGVRKFLDTFVTIETEKERTEMHETEEFKEIKLNAQLLIGGVMPLDKKFQYKKIIYSNGVTTILWEDGTKTTVRAARGEVAGPGAGIAYAFMKKALGNGNAHNKVLRKEVPKVLEAETKRLKKKEKKNGESKDS